MKEKRRPDWKKIIGLTLLVSLILSIGFSIVMMFVAPSEAIQEHPMIHIKGYYFMVLVECIMGIVVMSLPSMIQKKWSIRIPNYMMVVYFVFLYCSIYLGEVKMFYDLFPQWDTILHTLSGVMLGALGFTLVSILNDAENIKLQLSPVFVAIFAFCFALAAGAVWEIYEFALDGVLKINMQTYMDNNGTQFIGRAAVMDTMIDLIVDAIGGLVVAVVGYYSIKGQKALAKKKADKQAG